MNNIQYTIRAVPKELDTFLRKQARLRGRSLNQTVLDYIKQATSIDQRSADDDFSWIIGANTIDEASLRAIEEQKQIDKQKRASLQ